MLIIAADGVLFMAHSLCCCLQVKFSGVRANCASAARGSVSTHRGTSFHLLLRISHADGALPHAGLSQRTPASKHDFEACTWRVKTGPMRSADVAFGSNSEVGPRNHHVRFPPDSDQTADIAGGPFRATSGLMRCSKRAQFDHLIGASEQLIGTDSRTFLEPLSGLTVSPVSSWSKDMENGSA